MASRHKNCVPPPKSIMRVPRGMKPYLTSPNEKVLVKTKYITFVEDSFGNLYDKTGKPSPVKRYTWKNQNNIEAQVITYGARVTTMKVPDRAGCAEDIVLGCDDLPGYLFYDNLYMGATIGRTTNGIEGATFVADGKQYWVMADEAGGHYNGGKRGFDKVNWVPYVSGNRLILSYISRDGEQGYPGDLYVKIIFELTCKNEFKINIQANCTKTTPVDITNLIYFNLAGHEKGEKELRKHLLLLNSNCFTPYQDNGFPTGEIINVAHTRFDFQTPKLLNEMLGGYDQNFCVNRGVDQAEAFVARVSHPFTGRVLEIYSNQHGVNLYTCDKFGSGILDIRFPNFAALSVTSETVEANAGIFLLIKKLEEYCSDVLQMPEEEYLEILKTLTRKLLDASNRLAKDSSSIIVSSNEDTIITDFNVDFNIATLLVPLELQTLSAMLEAIPLINYDMDWIEIRMIIDCIVRRNSTLTETMHAEDDEEEEGNGTQNNIHKLIAEGAMEPLENSDPKVNPFKRKNAFLVPKNSIPKFYQDGRIHGKNGVIYRRYGGISLRTQNYPNAMYHKNFPSPIVRPDQTYTHSVTYKFWIQSGDPQKYLARMGLECLENENKNA